jgi:hypothetical protein
MLLLFDGAFKITPFPVIFADKASASKPLSLKKYLDI